MKKTVLTVFVIFVLLSQMFSFGIKQVEASGCNVSIVNVDPPSGSTIDDADVKFGKISVDVTLSWGVSIPFDNITGYDSGFMVTLHPSVWDVTKNSWQKLGATIFTVGKTTIPDSPKTITFSFDPTKRYLLNATIGVEYGDGQGDSGLLPDFKYCSSYSEYILDYHMKSELLLDASFTITPESPRIDDDAYFMSTSTAPNSNIIENKWYLDGQYLQAVGNSETWNSKLTKGTHTVELTVTDNLGYTDTESKTFTVRDTIVNRPILTVSTDKITYITHEKIIVNGKVTCGGNPLSHADVNLKIQQQNGKVNIWPGPLTGLDGTFKVEYEVPTTTLNTVPPNPETWTIEVTANPAEAEYGAVKESLTVQILPVYLKLHSIHLVQVVEAPVIDGTTYIAAGREAGLRVIVSCPNLKGHTSAVRPQVTISLNIEGNGGTIKPVQKKATIGADSTAVDFTFTLPPGTYLLNIRVDPYNEFMDTTYSQQLTMNQFFTSKEMNTLSLKFLAVELDFPSADSVQDFRDFCEAQKRIIEYTYPLPASNLKIETMNITYTNMFTTTRAGYLTDLSLRYFLEDAKIVGILPDTDEWWDRGKRNETGFAMANVFPGAVLVRLNAPPYVTAHEIGHTLGLNVWPWSKEEYSIYPPYGKQVQGLILKDGEIYNFSKTEVVRGQTVYPDVKAAFGSEVKYPMCFMGYNPGGGQLANWVCDETYPILFKELMDPPKERVLFVSGTIHDTNEIELNNWYIGKGLPDNPNEGNYTIQTISNSGEVMYSASFGLDTDETTQFAFITSFPESAAKVVIYHGEKVLEEVFATPNAPVINLVSPNGTEVINGIYEIRWNAEDYDDDPLVYSVLYSQNNGDTWTALALEIEETEYVLDFSIFPVGKQSLIKIVATDGFNTGEDISETTFTVNSNDNSSIDILGIVGIIAIIILVAILSVLIIRKRSKKRNILLPPPPPPPPPQY